MSSAEEDEVNQNENLICPICLNLPDNEIFQCKNGHAICAGCCKNMKRCPQCRVSYEEGKIRNRTMESFLGSIKTHCPYKSKGCTQIVLRRELQDHKIKCVYNGSCIQFCKLIGFNCDFWTNTIDDSTATNHLVDIHGFIYRNNSSTVNIRLENFVGDTLPGQGIENGTAGGSSCSPCQDSFWTPIILECKFRRQAGYTFSVSNTDSEDYSDDGDDDDSEIYADFITTEKFVIICKYHAKDRSLSWWCSMVGSYPFHASSHEVMFAIKSFSDKAPDLEWTVPTPMILHADVTIPMSPFRIPVESLHKYYVDKDGSLLVYAQIFSPLGYELVMSEGFNRKRKIETIWAFNISLKKSEQLEQIDELLRCNGCSSREVVYKCSTCCTVSYYVCGNCKETGNHPRNHVFTAVAVLDIKKRWEALSFD